MAYTRTFWANGEAPYINATNLNNIENGIFNNDAAITVNAANIAANLSKINTNTSNISSNAAAVAINTQDISDNAAAIAQNISDIATNAAAISSKADISYVDSENSAQDTIIENNTTAIASKIEADSYATDLVGGTIKIKVIGTDAYITTNGSTPGP